MTWTYAEIAAAYRALSPVPTSLASAAATLNAQTVAAVLDITTAAIDSVIVPTGEAYAITALGAKALSGASPPTQADQVIIAAWNVTRMLTQWQTIQTSNPAVLSPVQAALSGLQSAGVLSSASAAAILALINVHVPKWQPPITAGDLQTAGV
jgi:hypothetical protein